MAQKSLLSFFTPKRRNEVSNGGVQASPVDEKSAANSSTPKAKRRRSEVPALDESPVRDEFEAQFGRGRMTRNMIVESDSDEETLTKIEPLGKELAYDNKLEEIEPSEVVDDTKNNSSNMLRFSFDSTQDYSMNKSQDTTEVLSPSFNDGDGSAVDDLEWDTCEKFPHLDFDFLKPQNIKDAAGRRPDNPQYDHRTLFVPDLFLKKQTPGHRQWWNIKSKHYDTILFFKVGKFYELYHMDAVVAAKCLNLTYMRGKYAHCGFPEMAIGRFMDQMIERGYKVARIEQTETPEMLETRAKKERIPSSDRVVRREICRILTQATKMYSYLEGEEEDADASYLTAICEKVVSLSKPPKVRLPILQVLDGSGRRRIGTCFANCASGQIYLSEFADDAACSRLRTLLATFPSSQLLYPKNEISPEVTVLFKQCLSNVPCDGLRPKHEFLASSEALRYIAKQGYFNQEGEVNWPEAIETVLANGDKIAMVPSTEYALCISCLGAVAWYLKDCMIDHDVLSLRKMNIYEPPDIAATNQPTSRPNRYMVLDEMTLRNLNVIKVSDSDPLQSTLFSELDLCHTAMGKRLLRGWLCNPLYDVQAIRRRQEAVQDLLDFDNLYEGVCARLRDIPDLERLLQKLHSLSIKKPTMDHPECRAVFFDAERYNRRKVADFISLIKGLALAKSVSDLFNQLKPKPRSTMLQRLLAAGSFPDVGADLDHFQTSFDHEEALKIGAVIPRNGVDKELDDVNERIKQTNRAFDDFLLYAKRKFGSSAVKYIESGRSRFLLEVPEEATESVEAEFELRSQRKGFVRYGTAKLDKLLAQLEQCEAEKEACLKDIMRRLFADFCSRNDQWYRVVEAIATVDVLQAFAHYAKTCPHSVCRPVFVTEEKPLLRLKDSVHPFSSKIRTSGEFIPNDVSLGEWEGDRSGSMLLLTGANMGGKSTLMRQVGCLIIMAQVGAHLPASSFTLTPVDRIFTRIGARDSLMTGQSTLYIELRETSTILRHATSRSFVIMDELGRGTSTHDGTAMASACLKYLIDRVGCCGIFSTHYHNLVNKFTLHPRIQLGHMACVVENEGDEVDPVEESVTFLYKLAAGACPKSYGFNAAKLAGMDPQIIRNAFAVSSHFGKVQMICARIKQAAMNQQTAAAEAGDITEELLAFLKLE